MKRIILLAAIAICCSHAYAEINKETRMALNELVDNCNIIINKRDEVNKLSDDLDNLKGEIRKLKRAWAAHCKEIIDNQECVGDTDLKKLLKGLKNETDSVEEREIYDKLKSKITEIEKKGTRRGQGGRDAIKDDK